MVMAWRRSSRNDLREPDPSATTEVSAPTARRNLTSLGVAQADRGPTPNPQSSSAANP